MEDNSLFNIAVVIIGIIILIAVIFYLTVLFTTFKRELDYINREIKRTYGSEREHWKRQRKRLWLSLLPFSWKSR